MKTNLLELAYLYDFYAEVLTDKQRDYVDLYYHQDLSLSEIAENEGITRQGVRDIITRAEALLHHMEERIGLVARYGRIRQDAANIMALSNEIISLSSRSFVDPDIRGLAEGIRTLAEQYSS
ncbi:MAG: DNA-binding protein [Oscillospiraceae bacterium]|nr:DNA-binding protein [Oscillospiraceae bacterium]